ncbi:Putative arylsulfotransferase [Komagataella phaffii CBS 7435]|uniref:Arylsulfotransferase n=2 Tax=Komagataella phaffii TaxID=460519 RepID=C4R3C3_KOMPG|nr:Hypothetical protein PAS_chr3_0029 [Komagataella phaffii GS115]AOA63315.1 GQ67_03040T0 [Komagataella phaffii]CAH2450324.1 Putative arylsulfotransferase [Komagataella phaffii CBS 7435]AOA68414.1 GQ68_03025T0 [Komagataella phaffii GS115]CAY69958.1 Hypothetical protein PAS_chr3_0029 [Komagataella phaffii GS115]CCA40154.1 Putative arylsulfotransferase [Komagataella phaffii CBS 7435]
MKFLTLISVASTIATSYADWQYRTRPDLSPIELNITIPATDDKVSPGFLFAAPFSGYDQDNTHGPRQPGAYIFTDKGELVWSGFSYFANWQANFQASRINGENVLFAFEGTHNPGYGHGHGHITILNNRYETIKELRAGNHRISDKHEFHVKDEKTGLIQIYHPVPKDLSDYGASADQQWIVDAKFQELDLRTRKVLFEWSSLDHVSPHDSVLPINPWQAGSGYNSSDAWDYFHINSVDKDENGDYLISARNAAAIYKINGTDGSIIWKLGGLPGKTSSNFKVKGKPLTFSFQHHARFLSTSDDGSKQVFSFYDNSAHGTEDHRGHEVHYSDQSSGKIVEVNTETNEATLLAQYDPPRGHNLLSKSQGSTQVLSNGNVLVNWGSEGAVTEYTADGTPVFHAYFGTGELGKHVENYRAFKFDWHGYPAEAIALHSDISPEGDTIAYVSWNGDTETSYWKFYSIDKVSERQLLGKVPRQGFETKFKIEGETHSKLVVEAYNDQHRFLASSDVVVSEEQVEEKRVDTKAKFQHYFAWLANKD